ncbi:MAG: UvrB/UvrC motif-containing protein [Gemmatimonadetes bacterium]|nr:UvrB/UvrC motif-containing protein [Gemmatimonadota bacterium]
MSVLALPLTDPDRLKRRVLALTEQRPAVYRMVDVTGRVVYVGKAKRLRARLLSYFGSDRSDDRHERILAVTEQIEWDYQPSEFAALLGELRQIRRYRPPLNIRLNRGRRVAFIKVSGGPAPKLFVGTQTGSTVARLYGPLSGSAVLADAVRVLNDLLGLRDCSLEMPVAYAEQSDLFEAPRRAACIRHDLGTCSGPCAGLVSERTYLRRMEQAVAFLEGRHLAPLDQVISAMNAASEQNQFELAARWRQKFELLEWLLGALTRTRSAIQMLSFVYHDPGTFGDDRSYLIRGAQVRASAATPRTPIERETFRNLLAEHRQPDDTAGPLPVEHIDEMLLLLRWFRRHPGALRRTEPLKVSGE